MLPGIKINKQKHKLVASIHLHPQIYLSCLALKQNIPSAVCSKCFCSNICSIAKLLSKHKRNFWNQLNLMLSGMNDGRHLQPHVNKYFASKFCMLKIPFLFSLPDVGLTILQYWILKLSYESVTSFTYRNGLESTV